MEPGNLNVEIIFCTRGETLPKGKREVGILGTGRRTLRSPHGKVNRITTGIRALGLQVIKINHSTGRIFGIWGYPERTTGDLLEIISPFHG